MSMTTHAPRTPTLQVWAWEAVAGSHEFKITPESDATLKRGTR